MKKNEYVYPGSDLDRSKVLISLLGSFWARTYTGIDQIHSYVDATAYTVAQTYRNLMEVAHAFSRHDVPLFHEELLMPVVLRRSQLNSAATNTTRFDRNRDRFDDALVFDQPVAGELFSFPLPEKLRGAAQIFNRITYPTVALQSNIDFTVDEDRNALVFVSNPFDNPGFVRRSVQTNGQNDEEITLWAFCAQYDYEYVFNQFAYALGIRLKTSQNYKDFINAIFNGLVDGGITAKSLDLAISALCGIPVAVEQEEVIEVVEYDANGLLIVTDHNVYKFNENAIPNVAVGQRVRGGDRLVRGFEVDEFFVGNSYLRDEQMVPRAENTSLLVTNMLENVITEDDYDVLLSSTANCPPERKALAALALDNSFLSTCFYGDLMFENKMVPLVVDTNHHSGYTFVQFEVGGYPGDVMRFFEELHARGVALAETKTIQCFNDPIEYPTFTDLPEKGLAGRVYKTIDTSKFYDWVPNMTGTTPAGKYDEIIQLPPLKRIGTLAHLLDRRVQPSQEPTAENLPKQINPLRFVVENVLRNNVFVVRLNVAALGQSRLGLYNIRHLRQVLPPQTAMIVVFELTLKSDTISAEESVDETVDFFVGLEPQIDVVDENYVKDLGATLTRLSGTCQ